jgi:hypothetical protein
MLDPAVEAKLPLVEMKWLLGKEALQVDLQSSDLGTDRSPGASNHGTAFFNITLHGLQLLRQEDR